MLPVLLRHCYPKGKVIKCKSMSCGNTPVLRELQMRKSLHNIGLYASLWVHFLDCQLMWEAEPSEVSNTLGQVVLSGM